jgi:hypothetical protein
MGAAGDRRPGAPYELGGLWLVVDPSGEAVQWPERVFD